MNYVKVENMDHLKALASMQGDDFADFVLLIAGGLARSSKRIIYYADDDEFYIINEIDDSYQEVKAIDLNAETNLVAGIEQGSLFAVVD